MFNFAAFEAAHNPDHGAGPGARFGDPPIDSDPYALTPYRGGYAVADAAGNDLLWIGPKGAVSVLAVFPTQTVKLTKAVAKEIGAPATMRSISVQSVPTSVTVGPDGALYVGELTGVPFAPGKARIWRVVPGEEGLRLRLRLHEHLRPRLRRQRTCSCSRSPPGACSTGPRPAP